MSEERKRILSAALDEFAELGLIDSNIESIADRAKLHPGTVRALFLDKANLLRELLKEETDPMVSAIALAVEKIENPKGLLRKSLQLYDQWLMTHPKIVRLMVRCTHDGADSLKSLYEHSLLPSEFYERLEQMINMGQLRCNDIFILNLLLDSLIVFPHMIRSAIGLMNPEKSVDQIFEIRFVAIVDLLENGLFSG